MNATAPTSPTRRGAYVIGLDIPSVVRPLIPRVRPPNIRAHVTKDRVSNGILLTSTMSTMLIRVIARETTAMIRGR